MSDAGDFRRARLVSPKGYHHSYLVPEDDVLRRRLLSLGFAEGAKVTFKDVKSADSSLARSLEGLAVLLCGRQAPNRALEHLGFAAKRYLSEADLDARLALVWPEAAAREAFDNLDISGLLPLQSFRRDPAYDSIRLSVRNRHRNEARGRGRSLESRLDRLYEGIPLGTMLSTSYRYHLDPCSAGLLVARAHELGWNLAQDHLRYGCDPLERRLYRLVMAVAESHFGGKKTFNHALRYLLRKANGTSPDLADGRSIGYLGELFTKYLLFWTQLVDSSAEGYPERFRAAVPLPLLEVTPPTKGKPRLYVAGDSARRGTGSAGKQGSDYVIPDMRVTSAALRTATVEVKTVGVAANAMDLLGKYSSVPRWVNGRHSQDRVPDSHVVMLHTPKSVYGKLGSLLESDGYSCLSADVVLDCLRALEDHLWRVPFNRYVAASRPRIHDVGCLSRLYRMMSSRPHVLSRQSHGELRSYLSRLLSRLVGVADRGVRDSKDSMAAWAAQSLGKLPPAIDDCAEGASIRWRDGRPYLDVRPCVEPTSVSDAAARLVQGLRRSADLPVSRSLVCFDIETRGLSSRNQIYMIGMGYVDGERYVVRQLLARDPTEEEAILREFSRVALGSSALVSYNGRTYDLPRLRARFAAYHLKFPERPHVDLYPVFRAAKGVLGSREMRLTALERVLFRHARKDDLPGSEAPAAFTEYVNGGSPDKLCAVLRHNAEDVVAVGALFGLACERMPYRNILKRQYAEQRLAASVNDRKRSSWPLASDR